jgi:4-hydroxy-2-oxoheptanedioate aldolase
LGGALEVLLPMRFQKRLRSVALFVSVNLCFALAFGQPTDRLNKVISQMEAGLPALGVLSFDYSLTNARALSSSKLDFVIIDMEHSPFDVERLREFLLGMTNKRRIMEKQSLQPDVVPFVRIPKTGREDFLSQVKQVLDVGVFGVMFPSVENADETRLAIRSMRYPQGFNSKDMEPAGLRGRNPSNAVWYWGVPEYHARADTWPLDDQGELLGIIQIETPKGVENASEIASVPGVGAIFIGPSDLSTAMGFSSPREPEVEEAIQKVLSACVASKVPCAITTNARDVEKRLEQGFRMVTVGVDYGLPASATEVLRLGRGYNN